MCGNILVILSYFTYKPLQSNQNIFLVSLALADTFVALFILPFHIAVDIKEGKWIFGEIACHFFLTFDILLCTSSCIHLCFIALDRYWAIKYSIKYAHKRTVRFVLLMIFIAWFSSALISLPVTIWNTKTVGHNPDTSLNSTLNMSNTIQAEAQYISCNIPNDVVYRIYSSFGTFFIPLLIMTFVYFQIYLETKKRFEERTKTVDKLAKSMARSNRPYQLDKENQTIYSRYCVCFHSDSKRDDFNLNETASNESKNLMQKNSSAANQECFLLSEIANDCNTNLTVPKLNQTNLMKQNEKMIINQRMSNGITLSQRQKMTLNRERKATRTLSIIMGSFIICWFPFFTVYLLESFIEINTKLFAYLTCLGYVNSALNPVIYTIFNLDFRKSFKRILFECVLFKPRY